VEDKRLSTPWDFDGAGPARVVDDIEEVAPPVRSYAGVT
jgi:hypothetical protein